MTRTTKSDAPATAAPATAVPTREQFVREYMAQLSANRPPKVPIIDRLSGWAEDRVVAGVKNSRRSFGRLCAAWDISEQIRDHAYAEEHARHAEAMALRLGLK